MLPLGVNSLGGMAGGDGKKTRLIFSVARYSYGTDPQDTPIYTSEDDGLTWTERNTFLGDGSNNSVAGGLKGVVDIGGGVLATVRATGANGTYRVSKSTDGGLTWADDLSMGAGLPTTLITSMNFFTTQTPDKSKIFFLDQQNRRLYRSVDGCQTFALVITFPYAVDGRPDCSDQYVYQACRMLDTDDSQVYRIDVSTLSAAVVLSNPVNERNVGGIYVFGSTVFVFGAGTSEAFLFRSNDHGASWSANLASLAATPVVHGSELSRLSNGLMAIGYSTLATYATTTDNFDTFTSRAVPIEQFTIIGSSGSALFAVGSTSGSGAASFNVYRSTDGVSWTVVGTFLKTSAFGAVTGLTPVTVIDI